MRQTEYDKLVKFDNAYFFAEDYDSWKNDSLEYALATYLFDFGFDFNNRSWQFIENIRRQFGGLVSQRVLENMFKGNHDT